MFWILNRPWESSSFAFILRGTTRATRHFTAEIFVICFTVICELRDLTLASYARIMFIARVYRVVWACRSHNNFRRAKTLQLLELPRLYSSSQSPPSLFLPVASLHSARAVLYELTRSFATTYRGAALSRGSERATLFRKSRRLKSTRHFHIDSVVRRKVVDQVAIFPFCCAFSSSSSLRARSRGEAQRNFVSLRSVKTFISLRRNVVSRLRPNKSHIQR